MQIFVNGSAVYIGCFYIISALAADIIIRFILCALRELELRYPPTTDVDPYLIPVPNLEGYWWSIWRAFISTHDSALVRDFLYPFLLGAIIPYLTEEKIKSYGG